MGAKPWMGIMVQLPPIPIAAVGEPGHIGENGQAAVGPVLGVTLPKILRTIRALQAHELGAGRIDDGCHAPAVDCEHHRKPS